MTHKTTQIIPPEQYITASRSLSKTKGLSTMLGAPIYHYHRWCSSINTVDSVEKQVVIGWGNKPSTKRAKPLAKRLKVPFWRLEDGFIRSVGLGVQGAVAYSVVLDDIGIYYDADKPSRLECYLLGDSQFTDALKQRATVLMQRIVQARVSKYNHATLSLPVELSSCNAQKIQRKRVLVIDQTAGDLSLRDGCVSEQTFSVMLAAALRENPDADIFVKTHPDVIAGKKKGCLSLVDLPKQVCVITNDVNPLVLLEQMDHVYVATSQMGFEALMLGKAVTCFGVPFYAGWGVTDDRASADLPVFQRRNKPRSLEEIFAATYLLYARYWHPDTRQRCEAEDLVAFFELQYQYRVQAREDWCVLGLKRSFWKHRYLCHFLQANKKQVSYYRQPASAECKLNASCGIAVWGSRQSDQVAKLENEGATIWRVEDGFIRSVGLGSDYVAPQSLVIDRQGIYYDPSRPSDLEVLLQNYEFTEDLLHRARKLRQLLLDVALSKYNAGLALDMASLSPKLGQQIILVVGQVEDDASIQLGCREIKSNLALLRTVRDANPDHYIIYKPHPDVVSGNRVGYVSEEMVHCYADIQLDDISITECLDAVDEVHTMTSLVGFEALLRGLLVRCYGMPFYAGWGLTLDMYTLPRRNRVLSLDELVAASLILYPRYMNWETGLFTTPEFTLTSLAAQVEQQGGKQRTKQPWLLRQLRKLYLIYKGVTYRV